MLVEQIKVMDEISETDHTESNQSSYDSKEQRNYDDTFNYPQSRTCVKIHEQKSSLVLGDNNYNYWEELRQ